MNYVISIIVIAITVRRLEGIATPVVHRRRQAANGSYEHTPLRWTSLTLFHYQGH